MANVHEDFLFNLYPVVAFSHFIFL